MADLDELYFAGTLLLGATVLHNHKGHLVAQANCEPLLQLQADEDIRQPGHGSSECTVALNKGKVLVQANRLSDGCSWTSKS